VTRVTAVTGDVIALSGRGAAFPIWHFSDTATAKGLH